MKQAGTTRNRRAGARKIWILVAVIGLAAAAGGGYYFWRQRQPAQGAQAAQDTMYTSAARLGSINLSVTGSGTLAAGQEKNLSFSASGTVAKVNAAVGDQVKAGAVLAELANQNALQEDINTAQADLNSAQQELETLKQGAAGSLAEAQMAVVEAQKAVADAKSGEVQKGWARCDSATQNAYYYKYVHAKEYLDSLGSGDGSQEYYNNILLPQMNIVAQAKSSYDYCVKYTDYEISSSQAAVLVKQAALVKAQAALDSLSKNGGIDPIALATAENKVASKQLAMETAEETLAGATLTAPFDGTILSVAGLEGDRVGTDTFITVADLAHPLVNFSIDEADMDKIAVGQEAKVVFDALPNKTYTGKVTRIDPSLTTSGNYKIVTGVIQLDMSAAPSGESLLKGLTGTVTLVQGSAENVVLVPIAALRDLGDGTYSVFVVGADGKPRMRVVEIGLKDSASVEIKNGLQAGEIVSTGTTEVK